MTKVSFSVGPVLAQKAVPGNGLYVYAYGFVGGNTPSFVSKIIDNGTYNASASADIVPGSFSSGTILIVTQQSPSQPFSGTPLWPIGDLDPSVSGPAPSKTFGNIALMDSAAFNNYRYDSIELSLGNSNQDQGNLTNIVQYGSPISLTAYYTPKGGHSATDTQSRGYATTGSQLADELLKAYPTIAGNATFQNWKGTNPFDSSGQQPDYRETLTADTNGVAGLTAIANAADWNAYLGAMHLFQSGTRIAFFYAGNHKEGSTTWITKPTFFEYTVEYKDGYVKLLPVHNEHFSKLFSKLGIPWQVSHSVTMMPGTQADGAVWGANNSLAENIYAQVGNAYAFASSESADQYKTVAPPAANKHGVFASNTKYGFLNEILITGFEAGFFGASALPIPSAKGLSGDPPVDLNKMWNWNGLYGYGAVRPNDPAFPDFGYQTNVAGQHYDKHVAPVFRDSNAYGWSFSDFIANSFGGTTNPQISLWDSNANNGNGAQVGQVDIKVLDQADSPSGHYTPSSLSQYFLEPTKTATPSLTQFQGQNGFQLQFQSALNPPNPLSGAAINAPLAPVPDTKIQLRVHDGTKFVDIKIAASDYQNAYTVYAPGTGGYTEWTAVPGASKSGGLFYFQNMPYISASNSVTWYQLVLGTGQSQKTYNIYVQRGEPTASGYAASAIAVDGGAQGQLISYLPPSAATKNEAQVNLATGTTVSYDPGYWITADPSQADWSAPLEQTLSRLQALASPPETLTAPLVGKIAGTDTFSAFGSLSRITQGDIAFSYDSSGDNTTDGFNLAEIKLTSLTNPSLALTPIVAQADLMGRWQTASSSQFADGTYTARMEQFKPYDWGLKLPVGESTAPVTFTVQLDKLPLSAAPGGHALQFTQGSSASSGNWIELDALASSLPNGTLVAYATNSSGQMLLRDGSGITTSIDDAALGRIGSVASDSGQVFFSGSQHLYLPAGQQLHFAIVAANGQVDPNPTVNVSGSGDTLTVQVSDSFGGMTLTAKANNTLDESAMLAASQRATDHSWVYLKQGATVKVDLAWSGDYVNTLHFVRMDRDPDNPALLRVGDVAYGNTDAFRGAVAANWEFSSTQGHSTGTSTATWTVAGADGFYAPVLVSGRGDIWMINQTATSTANVDGQQHIRNFGANTFGFEDMNAAAGADFDFNDMVMHLSVL